MEDIAISNAYRGCQFEHPGFRPQFSDLGAMVFPLWQRTIRLSHSSDAGSHGGQEQRTSGGGKKETQEAKHTTLALIRLSLESWALGMKQRAHEGNRCDTTQDLVTSVV